MTHTQMRIDVASREFSFGFAPGYSGAFLKWDEAVDGDSFLHTLCEEASAMATMPEIWPRGVSSKSTMDEFPELFSSTLGTAKGVPLEIDLLNVTPVRSPPYRFGPPKLAIFRRMVNELLEQGVVRPSRFPYASPAFLVPKSGGDYRMIVNYRKVNANIVFDSYPMPTVEQAFKQFGGAVVLSVSDLNSAYYQIPLSQRSRRVTAFCTPHQ